jgi:glucose-1-phosphate cytidylyltransferase
LKAVILAGGLGTRISEETGSRPKPMIEIGGKPILWHIMKIYGSAGINEFVICLGYKGYVIKEYFANYYMHTSDVTFDLGKNSMHVHSSSTDPWTVTLLDTGDATMTGGRLRRVAPYIGDQTFCATYGDGVSDVDIAALIAKHKGSGCAVTMTAVQPPGRFGALELDDDRLKTFQEKPLGDGGWINGGFFVMEPSALQYIDNDEAIWEREPLERLAAAGQVNVHKHHGFWQPLDTLRDKHTLDDLWSSGRASWKTW